MRLAAVYIHEHEYLFKEPQIINFGGEFLYNFKLIGENLYVSRKKNEKYIPNLFNSTSSQSKIKLVSAVVGENGIGKSSFLDCIRGSFIENSYALPDYDMTAIVETEDTIKLIISRYKVFLIDDENILKLKFVEKNSVQSIYYSPHFDLKYNFNFSDFDQYNISLDTYIEKDLENLDKKDTNESGGKYHPVEELVFKNSLRQISFLSSSIYKKNDFFRELFKIPNYEKGILYFREYVIDPEYWNVPRNFKYFFKDLFKKIEEEIELWTDVRKFDKNHTVLNQAEIWCYLLERKIISSFCSTLIEQMNKQNTYLEEGIFKVENLKEYTKGKNSLELFKFLLEYSFIKKGQTEFKIFKHEHAFELIDYIFNKIRTVKNENEISKSSVNLSFDEIAKILQLHRLVLLDLFNYYPTNKKIIKESSYIEGFIAFRPTDKFLSSGENALLNFYSKLYNFINTYLLEESKFRENKKHYILLLDEADLGYHPTWKKKFIYSLINTLPYFFEDLEVVPDLQIIFTTHDPLTLSDIPNSSVIYLKKDGHFSKILKNDDIERPQKTFGANINDLLADSFFVEDGLIGEFAKSKIAITLNWLKIKANDFNKSVKGENYIYEIDPNIEILKFQSNEEEYKYHREIIELIGEPLVKNKLMNMFIEFVNDDSISLKLELEKAKARVLEIEKRLADD